MEYVFCVISIKKKVCFFRVVIDVLVIVALICILQHIKNVRGVIKKLNASLAKFMNSLKLTKAF